MRITSFRHKGLERFWMLDDARGLPRKQIEKIRAMLTAIAEAAKLQEIERYSGWRLHPLKGGRAGTWSMVLTRSQRITFKLSGEDEIREVDLEDYH